VGTLAVGQRRLVILYLPEGIAYTAADASQAVVICQLFSDGFCLAQMCERLLILGERGQRTAQQQPEIDGLLVRGAVGGEVGESRKPLFKVPHGFPVGRCGDRFVPRLAAVGEGLVPHLAPQGVLDQKVYLLVLPVTGQFLQCLNNLGMQGPAPLLEQTIVGHLVCQGMLEGVGWLGEAVGLIEELGGLEVRQPLVQRRLRQLGNGLQQRHGDIHAHDRGGLQETLGL
jgi:hypothetical protein